MKILFVCHGNICRSPMAEFVMKDLLRKAGRDDVVVESAALHTDEIGSDIHRGTRRELERHGIPYSPRCAWLLDAAKAAEYDLIIGMDRANLRNMHRIYGGDPEGKLHLLMDFTDRPGLVTLSTCFGASGTPYRFLVHGVRE